MRQPTTTDRNYRDLVDPFVRAEEEAQIRGYWEGFCAAIFYGIVAIVGVGMLLVALNAHANVTWVQQTWAPIKASQCGGRLSICQNNATSGKWLCYCVA